MRGHVEDQLKVDQGVVAADIMETLDHINHALVLECSQDKGENGKHTNSGKHIQVHEVKCCGVRQVCQHCQHQGYYEWNASRSVTVVGDE